MANTLFIVEDESFFGLPETARKRMLEEIRRLFGFVPHFKVETKAPVHFPTVLEFTDSVVKLVDTDDDVGSAQNSINLQQISNIKFSITQKKLHLKIEDGKRFAGVPERGGVGTQWKQVVKEGGGKMVSLTLTYGVASIESAKSAVIEAFAGGRTKQDIASDVQKAIAKRGLTRYFASHDSLKNTRDRMENELMDKPLNSWPDDHQDAVAVALGRLVAHEARHQYVVAHSGAGLGASEAVLWGDKNFENFDKSDQGNVVGNILKLATDWRNAIIHLETCPRGRPSPFM